jgi:GTPase SAR1 family protein
MESNSKIKKNLTIIGDVDCGKTSLLFVQTKDVFPGVSKLFIKITFIIIMFS